MNGTQFDSGSLFRSIFWFHRKCENEEQVLVIADSSDSDEDKLAAALLLCTCDSNERKAE